MENSEFQVSKDLKSQITETVPIPQVPGEYLHISTSKEQLGNFFEEYANLLDFDGAAARNFLQEKVDVVFTPISPSLRDLPQSKTEYLIDEITSRVAPKNKFGETAYTTNNRITISIDVQNIAKLLTGSRIAKGFPNYSGLPKEGKIATIEAVAILAMTHELRHVIQLMNESERVKEYQKKAISIRRAMAGAIVTPALTLPIALSSQLGMLAATGINLAAISPLLFKEVQYFRKPSNIENDAYHATENPNLVQMSNRPFNFEIETDSTPSLK